MSNSIPNKPTPSAPEAAATAAAAATPPPTNPAELPYYGTPAWLHAGSVACAILGPIGLALPPRRMGLRNLMLAAGTFFATSQVTYDYTGQSLFQRFQFRASEFAAESELPESARLRQAAMKAERERRRRIAAGLDPDPNPNPNPKTPADAAAATKDESALHKLWMGDEKADWVKERAQREKEALDSGEGYSGLILGQIAEVWTGLMKKGPDSKAEERHEGPAEPSDKK